MTFTTLYATLLVLAFGGYFAIKYLIKGLTKIGAFDDGESRYSPPTTSTYVGFWVTSTVLVILFLLTAL